SRAWPATGAMPAGAVPRSIISSSVRSSSRIRTPTEVLQHCLGMMDAPSSFGRVRGGVAPPERSLRRGRMLLGRGEFAGLQDGPGAGVLVVQAAVLLQAAELTLEPAAAALHTHLAQLRFQVVCGELPAGPPLLQEAVHRCAGLFRAGLRALRPCRWGEI